MGSNQLSLNNFLRAFNFSGNVKPSLTSSFKVIWHIWSNIFFQTSLLRVVRVTHNILYPAFSKLFDAVATPVQVFPVPTECHKIIPLYGDSGQKKLATKFCVGFKSTSYASLGFSPGLGTHLFSTTRGSQINSFNEYVVLIKSLIFMKFNLEVGTILFVFKPVFFFPS